MILIYNLTFNQQSPTSTEIYKSRPPSGLWASTLHRCTMYIHVVMVYIPPAKAHEWSGLGTRSLIVRRYDPTKKRKINTHNP